jgi:hypothetical protein
VSFRRRLPALPAVVTISVALAVPFLTASEPQLQGTAGSVTARAAQSSEGEPGGDQRYPVGGPAIEAAKATAAAHWGAQPCGGQVTLTWTPLDMGTNATATWRNPTDAWNNPGENFDCRIDLNPGADFDYPKLCTVLTHELGHLLGQQHDPNSGQLMSAYYTGPIPACETADPGAPATADQTDAADLDIIATHEPRRALRKKTTASTRTVRRCKVIKKAGSGKRVKRCVTVKAKKADRSGARPVRR